MIYPFECECGATVDVEASFTDFPLPDVKCGLCGKKMHRIWSSSKIQIPEHMRASNDSDFNTSLNERMRHAKRPSGKDKVVFSGGSAKK